MHIHFVPFFAYMVTTAPPPPSSPSSSLWLVEASVCACHISAIFFFVHFVPLGPFRRRASSTIGWNLLRRHHFMIYVYNITCIYSFAHVTHCLFRTPHILLLLYIHNIHRHLVQCSVGRHVWLWLPPPTTSTAHHRNRSVFFHHHTLSSCPPRGYAHPDHSVVMHWAFSGKQHRLL